MSVKLLGVNESVDSLGQLLKFAQKGVIASVNFFEVKQAPEVIIHIFYDRETFDMFRGSQTQDWVVSVVQNGEIGIFSPEVFDKVSNHPKEDFPLTLAHEIAHLFLTSYHRFRYPVWLKEGIPGYLAGPAGIF